MLASTLFRSISECEINAWRDMYAAAGKDISDKFGIKIFSIGSACVSIASGIDNPAHNRVLGLGLAEPATEQILDEIISKYKEADVKKIFIQLHPESSPPQLSEWFKKRNIHYYNNRVKHYRGVEEPPEVETDFEIREFQTKNEAGRFGEIITKSFGLPDDIKYWFASLAGRKYWKTYLAFENDKAIATASLFVKDDFGWLSFAGTLPDYRKKGAQTALIAKRIRDAAELGCKVLTAETNEKSGENRSQSLQYLQKMGFEVAFTQLNFLCEQVLITRK